jgi:hypothetical protein
MKHLKAPGVVVCRFRLWAEAMVSGATATTLLPGTRDTALRQWAQQPPTHPSLRQFMPTTSDAELTVTSLYPNVTSAWNITTRLVEFLTIDTHGIRSQRGDVGTRYRLIVSDLNGLVLEMSNEEFASLSSAWNDFATRKADTPEFSAAVSPSFIAPRELHGMHPRIIAPHTSLNKEQCEIIELIHGPIRKLRQRCERAFKAVCRPPSDSPNVKSRTDNIRMLLMCLGITQRASPPRPRDAETKKVPRTRKRDALRGFSASSSAMDPRDGAPGKTPMETLAERNNRL